MTSSTLAKPMGNTPGHNAAGKWTAYSRQGKPMDIDRQKIMSEGRCFRCHKKGHILKDCPKKKKMEVCAVAVPEEALAKDTKIEEVKD